MDKKYIERKFCESAAEMVQHLSGDLPTLFKRLIVLGIISEKKVQHYAVRAIYAQEIKKTISLTRPRGVKIIAIAETVAKTGFCEKTVRNIVQKSI